MCLLTFSEFYFCDINLSYLLIHLFVWKTVEGPCACVPDRQLLFRSCLSPHLGVSAMWPRWVPQVLWLGSACLFKTCYVCFTDLAQHRCHLSEEIPFSLAEMNTSSGLVFEQFRCSLLQGKAYKVFILIISKAVTWNTAMFTSP